MAAKLSRALTGSTLARVPSPPPRRRVPSCLEHVRLADARAVPDPGAAATSSTVRLVATLDHDGPASARASAGRRHHAASAPSGVPLSSTTRAVAPRPGEPMSEPSGDEVASPDVSSARLPRRRARRIDATTSRPARAVESQESGRAAAASTATLYPFADSLDVDRLVTAEVRAWSSHRCERRTSPGPHPGRA